MIVSPLCLPNSVSAGTIGFVGILKLTFFKSLGGAVSLPLRGSRVEPIET